jgi:glyoxylase-like metal-dependent hydrolase (beta-lactamase superfamily II)
MKKSAAIFICLLSVAAAIAGQDAAATKVVRAALDKLGGEAKIRSLRSIYFTAKGFEDSEVNAQPFSPGRSAHTAHEEKLAVFLDGRRLAYELKTDRGDGTRRHRRFYFPDSRRIVADFVTRSAYSSDVKYPSTDRDQDARRIPHMLLLEAVSSPRLRYEGVRSFAGAQHDVLSVGFPNDAPPLFLFVNKATKLVSKYEFTADFPGLGSSLIEYTFNTYTPHHQLGFFPSQHEIRINGKVFRGLEISRAAADSAEADEMLQLPADMEGLAASAGFVKRIANGIYFVYNLRSFQPMFIEFDSFVVAIEAPASVPVLEDTPIETWGDPAEATKLFIEKIKQTIPNKPIKYVVVTHAHADHFGGLRKFIPENPIVLTTPGNESFLKKFVPELKIEVVNGKRMLSDRSQAVELIDVGRNPHTEENLIVYLPRINYLFQGDLFYFNNEATFPARDRMTVMPFFAKWLKTNGLAPERIYGFHSTMFGTMEHIEKILKLSSQTSQL